MLHVGSAPVDPEKVHLAILEKFLNSLILCRSLRWILLLSEPLVDVIYRKEHTLVLGICKPVFVLWKVCLDDYGHPEKKGGFLILYTNLTLETLKMEGQMLKEEKDGHCLNCK